MGLKQGIQKWADEAVPLDGIFVFEYVIQIRVDPALVEIDKNPRAALAKEAELGMVSFLNRALGDMRE